MMGTLERTHELHEDACTCEVLKFVPVGWCRSGALQSCGAKLQLEFSQEILGAAGVRMRWSEHAGPPLQRVLVQFACLRVAVAWALFQRLRQRMR